MRRLIWGSSGSGAGTSADSDRAALRSDVDHSYSNASGGPSSPTAMVAVGHDERPPPPSSQLLSPSATGIRSGIAGPSSPPLGPQPSVSNASDAAATAAVTISENVLSPPPPSSSASLLQQQPQQTQHHHHGFPFSQKVLICNVLLVDSTADSMLFAYVGLLVARLDPSYTRSTAGYASGVLLGLYQASQFFALPRWGRLSDGIGRKPVLQASLLLCCLVSLLFGSSTSLLQAVVARLLHGCVVAGNITIKSYVAETTTERTAAAAFSMVALARAVGGAIGPLVGGLLYDPTGVGSPLRGYFRGPSPSSSPSSLFSSGGGGSISTSSDSVGSGSSSLSDDGGSFWFHLFAQRPALLPAMALAVYAICVLLMVNAWLRESNAAVLAAAAAEGKKKAPPSFALLFITAKAQCRQAAAAFASLPSTLLKRLGKSNNTNSNNVGKSDSNSGRPLAAPSSQQRQHFHMPSRSSSPKSPQRVGVYQQQQLLLGFHSLSNNVHVHHSHSHHHPHSPAGAGLGGGQAMSAFSTVSRSHSVLTSGGDCHSLFGNGSIVSRASTLSAMTAATTPRSQTPLEGSHRAISCTVPVGGEGCGASLSPLRSTSAATKGAEASHPTAADCQAQTQSLSPERAASIEGGTCVQVSKEGGRGSEGGPQELSLLAQVTAANAALNAQSEVSFRDVWSHPALRVLTPMYASLTSFNIWFMEVLPLYCIAARADGGLGLGAPEVSALLAMVAVANFVGNLLFPKVLARAPSSVALWRWSCLASAAAIAATPLVGAFAPTPHSSSDDLNHEDGGGEADEGGGEGGSSSPFLALCLLFAVPTIVRVFTTIWCFSMNTIFFTNVAPKRHLGAVTAMSYASGAGARALAPMIAAPIFAWSVAPSSPSALADQGAISGASGGGGGGPHVYVYVSFVLCGALAVLCMALSMRLDEAVVGRRHP